MSQPSSSYTTPTRPSRTSSHQSDGNTPFSKNTATVPHVLPPGQFEMKKALRAELQYCIWTSNKILDIVLPADNTLVDAVNSSRDLGNLFVVGQHPSIRFNGKMNPWPTAGIKEREHYESLCSLLNGIFSITQGVLSKRKTKKYFTKISCSIYDKEIELYEVSTRGGSGSRHALKPDLVFSSGGIRKGKDFRVTWAQVDIAIEVKATWLELIDQAASYARCMFAAPEEPMYLYRRFAMVFMFNHTTMEFSFAIFHRSGCTRTPPMPITTKDGLNYLVRVLAGIKSIRTKEGSGYDVSLLQDALLKNYKFGAVLFQRVSVVGRGTDVTMHALNQIQERARRMKQTEDENAVEHVTKALEGTTIHVPSQAGERWSSRIADKAAKDKAPTPTVTNLPAPGELPYYLRKDWWSPRNRNNEQKMFEKVKGKFGLPKLNKSYPVTLTDEPGAPDTTEKFIPDDATIDPLCLPKQPSNKKAGSKPASSGTRERSSKGEGRASRESIQRKTNTQSNPAPSSSALPSNSGAPEAVRVPEVPPPVIRDHMRTVLETAGVPLEEAETPAELFKAVAHAIIGHWNLFIDDWLHRDVSLGNVMLLEEPEEREPVYDFTDIKILETTQEKCIGMIIDGDHAIIWWRRRGPQAGHRSGTLPYLSLRLCRLWSAGQHTQLPHTALDDLESFIWVLMHVILMKIPSSLVRNQWLEGMAREDLPTLFQAKGHIRAEISYWENGESAPHPALEAFAGVLIALFKIAGRAGAECARLAKDVQGMERDDIVSACKPYYEEYLSTILDALDTLPEEWPTSDAYELPQEYVEEDSPSDSGDEC